MKRPKLDDTKRPVVHKYYCHYRELEKFIDQLEQEKCVSRKDCKLYCHKRMKKNEG